MRRSQLEKLFAERDGDSLRTVCGSDFREYRRHVFVDAVLADPELFCYVAVGEASHHRLQNFGLTGREHRNRRIFGQEVFDLGRDYGLPACHGSDRGDKRFIVGGLHECSDRSRFDCVGDAVGRAEGRKDYDLGSG